ncbi:hydrolase [Streptomyces lincolnensis]|nr:hydrolase [Streptomyces lincolnensis]
MEVEAESISVPAGLLGVDAARAAAALEQAREQFRTGCVRAHRELAPSSECRFYNRLLDVPIRRGGALLPDVQQHLTSCRYCRHAAEQLSHFEGGLEALLAETVLGWGAHRYLDSRPDRATGCPATPARQAVRTRVGGRHRPSAGLLPPSRGRAKAVLVGAGLTSLALLATVLVARGWSEEGGAAGPGPTWGAISGNSVTPGSTGTSDDSASGRSPSAASVGNPVEVGHGRLHNSATGLCLDVLDGSPEDGAAAVLAACSAAGSQQWTYQDDGLLRSATTPTLCLDADADEGTVVLADCVVHAGEVRYDLTVRGELLLRRGEGRLVAPGPGRTVVVTERDHSAEQRWMLERADEQPNGTTGGPHVGDGTPDGPLGRRDAPETLPSAPGTDDSLRKAPEDPSAGPETPPERFETRRVAEVDCCQEGEPAGPAAPLEGAGTGVVGGVLDGAVSTVTQVGTAAVTTVTAGLSLGAPRR